MRLSVSMELKVADPTSMESPVKMRTFGKSCAVVSHAAAEKNLIDPISKVRVRLVSLPNVKVQRSKTVSGHMSYKTGGESVIQ
jgi:hypothetical protein